MSKIKKARLNAKLTQAQMSELMAIPKRTIEDWDTGKSSPPIYVERLVIAELERIANIKMCKPNETDLEKFKNLFGTVGVKYNEQQYYFDKTLTELAVVEPLDERYNTGLKVLFTKDGKLKEFSPSGE